MTTPNYLQHSEVKPRLDSRAFSSDEYNGQLDEVDPVELGKQVRRKFGIDSNHKYESPSEKFIGGKDDDPRWDFLHDFYERFNRGWWQEHRLIAEQEYNAKLDDFIGHVESSDIKTGSEVLYQPLGKENWIKVRIDFIHKDSSAVAVSLIDTKPEEMKLIGHKHGFGRFKTS